MNKKGMKIILTPGQAVTVHGWLHPKEWLSWGDILANEKLSVEFLMQNANVPKELLHRLQPDLLAWVQSGRIGLAETQCLHSVFAAHPIKDLKADFPDLVALKWSAQAMRRAGVTYKDLCEAGMTHDTMGLFGYTLYDWSTLGFCRQDAEAIPAACLGRLFGMMKTDVMRCLV
jgi:hypothetical protein